MSATPESVEAAFELAKRWGARGAYFQWGFDSMADPGAPVLLATRPALGRLARLTRDAETLIDGASPGLVLAYPARGRFPLTGDEDSRPLALSGEVVGGRAVQLADGRWLVPAGALSPEFEGSYVVSLPCARVHRSRASELAAFLNEAPDARLLLLGPREDLGFVPPLARLLPTERGPCPYGAGASQLVAEGVGATPMGEGYAGCPALYRCGSLLLFPVGGLTDTDALWLLDSLCGARGDGAPDTPGGALAGTAVSFGEESDDGGP